MAHLLPSLIQRFLDANGDPLVGGKVFSYAAGTSTPLATYTDQTEATPNTNPIILDANGECQIWVGASSYKFVVKGANDVVLETLDGVAHNFPGSVTTIMLANGAVTNEKIADDSISAVKLQSNSVTTIKIQDLAVTTAKIANEAVTAGKLATDAVETAKIKDLNVTTSKLADASVTAAKLSPLVKSVSPICISHQAGSFATPVTSLITSLTTTGRKVRVGLESGQLLYKDFANSLWRLWTLQVADSNVTATIQAGTAVTIFPMTIGQGWLIQSPIPFSKLVFNVSTASATGAYTYEYWNGSAWTTLSLTTTPVFTSTGSKTMGFDIPSAWVPGCGSEGADQTYFSVRVLVSTAPATAVQINSMVVSCLPNSNYISGLLHGVTGNSTTASTLNANLDCLVRVERHTSSSFPVNPVVVGIYTYTMSGLIYNGQFMVQGTPANAIDFIDDDGGAGLAAGTYYYRVVAQASYGGNASTGSTTFYNVKLRAEEVM